MSFHVSPIVSVLAFCNPRLMSLLWCDVELECGNFWFPFLDLLTSVEAEISLFFPLPVRCLIIQNYTSCEYDLPFFKGCC